MSVESIFYAAMVAAPSVAALVSDRVYPDFVPQEEPLPAICFARSVAEFINTIHGTVAAESVTLEVTCLAENRSDADAIAEAVKVAASAVDFAVEGGTSEVDPATRLYAAVLNVTLLH